MADSTTSGGAEFTLNVNGVIQQRGTNVALSNHTHTPSSIGAAAASHGTHVSYSSTKPVMDGTASVGSASTVARSDHRHPTDTSRVPTTRKVNNKALSGDITLTAADVGALPISGGAIIRDNGISFSTGESKVQAAIVKSGDDGIWLGCANALPDAQSAVALGSIADPEYDYHAANKKYVDDAISSRSPLNHTHTAAEVGALASGGTAAAATKLATSRTIRTNLGSTSTASFNGTANITPGVTGTLGIANGGTGSTTASGALANLGADSRYLKLSGGDMTGMLDMNNNALTGIKDPVSPTDAVSYRFMMNTILNILGSETTVTFCSSNSSYSDYAFTVDLEVVDTTGDLAVFSMNKTVSIPKSSTTYNNVKIKIPSAFKSPGVGWSEIGYIGPIITIGSEVTELSIGSSSDSYSINLSKVFSSGTVTVSGNLIVKFK